jgi:hypothetical protein
MKPARIVLDQPVQLEKSWCWRDDWVTGFDSAYGLLSKFAKLNAMGARELAQLFIDRGCGQRTAIVRAPKVDLRTCSFFDLTEMARVLRLDPEHLRHAFLLDRLTNSLRRSSDVLRWCPRCANAGFHSPVFQLDLLAACPAHGRTIRSRCPKCRAQIPYRLQPDVFAEPFCCPSCNADLAPALRDPKTRSLQMREPETAWITNMTRLFSFEDEMLPVKMELNRQRKLLGIGEAVFASGDWRRIESEYTGFVIQVLDDLEAERSGVQRALSFDQVSVTVMSTVCRPERLGVDRRKRARRAKAPPDIQSSSALKRGWDDRLHASYQLYGAVRRHLWRHVVHEHQDCISTAGHHLWWHMEGEHTASFCPIAEAFLRWRMFWEACGTPCYLFAPMRKDPFGLAVWMASGAPVCPAGWTWEAEQWVSDHVLGRTCLGSFRDFLDIALRDRERDRIDWDGHALSGRYESYWAVAGRDTLACPVRIYEQLCAPYQFRAVLDEHRADHAHHHEHLTCLACVQR